MGRQQVIEAQSILEGLHIASFEVTNVGDDIRDLARAAGLG